MIDINEIFSDADSRIAWLCEGAGDTSDLAMMCEHIIQEQVHLISVNPDIVPIIWTYLEKAGVKIFARYEFATTKRNIDDEMYCLAADITKVLKKGASGIQIFIKMSGFEDFIEKIAAVRDDLFFGHDVCFVFDISEINVNDWGIVFQKLRDIRADAFGLTLREDMGNRSDFVGRIYGMLKNWDFSGGLHLFLDNNFDRMDQVIRLVACEKPELNDKLRFFLNY